MRLSKMLTLALLACPVTLSAQQASPAVKGAADGTWKGEMKCAKLSFNKGGQKVPIEVVVSGGSATFSREVWNEDRSAVVGTETGAGEVGAGGAIKLTSEWRSAASNPSHTFTATYAGKLKGRAGSLNGTQVWMTAGKTEDRPCSISLRR